MTEIELRVDVDAPAAAVWDAAVDWDTQGDWMLGTRVAGTVQGGRGVGGGIEAFTGVGPLGVLDTMVITEWDPPRRCVVRHTGRVVRGGGVFEVVALGPGRARFVWSEQLDLPLGLLGRVGFALLRPLFVAGVRVSLKRFAEQVSSRSRSPLR